MAMLNPAMFAQQGHPLGMLNMPIPGGGRTFAEADATRDLLRSMFGNSAMGADPALRYAALTGTRQSNDPSVMIASQFPGAMEAGNRTSADPSVQIATQLPEMMSAGGMAAPQPFSAPALPPYMASATKPPASAPGASGRNIPRPFNGIPETDDPALAPAGMRPALMRGQMPGQSGQSPGQERSFLGISPDMLLALGAGIAGNAERGWGAGIGAGLSGALRAKDAGRKRDSENLTYKWLRERGLTEGAARAGASNPAVLTQLFRNRTGVVVADRLVDRETGKVIADFSSLPGSSASRDPSNIREAEVLVRRGVAPDFQTAYNLVRQGVNSTSTFQRLVQAEKKNLQDRTGNFNLPDSELESMARRNVIERAAAMPMPGSRRPVAGASPAAQGSPQGNEQALASARAAIASGAPRDAVIQRLIENGIDPAGL